MKAWASEHPGWAALLALFGAGTLITYPALIVFLVAAGVIVGGSLIGGWGLARRRDHRAALAARADYEHAALMAGHPAGTFGRYPPAI
ncbi:MAG: hypothetical protein ACRDTI_20935 [Mycobacterium sp.]